MILNSVVFLFHCVLVITVSIQKTSKEILKIFKKTLKVWKLNPYIWISVNTWQSSPYRSFVPDIRLDATSSHVLLPHYLHTENTYILCHSILFYNFTQLYCSLYYFTFFYYFLTFSTILGFSSFCIIWRHFISS